MGAQVESGAGAVLLVSGATGIELGRLQGNDPLAMFGAALVGLQDLDGDGIGELAVGMPYYGLGLGRVEIRSPISGQLLFFQNGLRADGAFGLALDAGDLDGNGAIELVVGQPGKMMAIQPKTGAWHGAVRVISVEPSNR